MSFENKNNHLILKKKKMLTKALYNFTFYNKISFEIFDYKYFLIQNI